jgi:CBS-domain-containing membrane protein
MNEHASVQVLTFASSPVSVLTLNAIFYNSQQRCYRVFRTLGLRHLLVVNSHNQVQGIITRQDLVGSTADRSGSDGDHNSVLRNRRRKATAQRKKRSDSDTIGQIPEAVDL